MSDTKQQDADESIPLDADGDVRMPVVDVLTGRGFITGKSGSGKSSSGSVILEELLDRGLSALVVDVDGEYWGLKEDYEILHVGADEECDLQVGPEHGSKLAELALAESVPIILDVSGFLDADRANALLRETAQALFTKEKKRKRPFLMLVEEIHEYIPEGGGLDATGELLVKIGKRGRKHGLGIAGISQRPADVKKDFITQCDWLLWHRLTWDNDTKVVRRVVDSDTADAVQDLADGEGFLMADWRDEAITRVQVRRKRTFDAGATPDLDAVGRPDLKAVSGDLVDELEAISEAEQRRQDEIAQLEAENEDLRKTIEKLQDELERARDMSDMAEQFSEAMLASAGGGNGEALEAKVEEIREEKNARIADLEQENEALRDDLRELRETKADLEARLDELEEYEHAVENMEELREAARRMAGALGLETGEADEQLRERLQQKDERIDNLEAAVSRLESKAGGVTVPTEYESFVEDDVVQAAIEDAKDGSNASPRYVKGVVAAILEEGGPVDYDTVAEYLGVSTTSDVSKAASTLEAHGVIEEVDTRPKRVDFDMEAIAEIKERNRRRERAESVMEGL
jgi:prefoldin subunit 5